MTGEEALRYIEGFERFGSRLGLERMALLLERLGNPQEKLHFIHVAGTNGKGSVTASVATVLTACGYRTGRYISPYVLDFTERIEVDQQPIPMEALGRECERVKREVEQLAAEGEIITVFELVTALALCYYADCRCDFVVLEVGLGGRFDATNAIPTPEVSVIMKIGLDHTEILGDTLAKIAYEKCGIVKPGGVTISYPKQDEEALAVIRRRCEEEDNPLILPDLAELFIEELSLSGSLIRYRGKEYRLSLIGEHQVYNAITAIEVLRELRHRGYQIPEERVPEQGLQEVFFPARLELLRFEPLVLLDGAHNPDGAAALEKALRLLKGKKVIGVMGMLSDKDYRQVMKILSPHLRQVFTVTPNSPRALPAEELATVLRELSVPAEPVAVLSEAYPKALAAAGKDEAILLCGSLYLASDLRRQVLG